MSFKAATNVLLTGAGFTKNFGGLLGGEIWSVIFNHSAVRSIKGLAKHVSARAPDFEAVYEGIVRADPGSPEGRAIHQATLEAYHEMDMVLRTWYQDHSSPEPAGVAELIRACAPARGSSEVGLLFTLNQDLYPERFTFLDHAYGEPGILATGPPAGLSGSYFENRDMKPVRGKDLKTCPDKATVQSEPDAWLQRGQLHWVKLHGSYNWRSATGGDVMVLGRDKDGQISREPLLQWYWELFRSTLLSGRRRVIVVGYSFRDPHVNEMLADSVVEQDTELIVIDPAPWTDFKERMEGPQGPSRGADLVGQLDSGGHSGYFATDLTRLFPYGYGSETADWSRVKQLLRTPLS